MEHAEPAQRLGQFIKQTRIKKGLSYRQVADFTGLANNTIWRIEHGEINQPRPEVLISIGRALNIPAADLYALANYPSPEKLPSFGPYLRARYQDLTPEQIAQLEGYFQALAAQSNISLDGPEPGEDEIR
ncbi:helix-turn-helix transcriptional regulator [Microbacterium sp.]|uniref:helix-turn-helix domain-containing protein n=1 Tax=Microbacterium sp. TaxID=51671 RepID=UPI0025E54A42|nr:helix-turn-helix transcriptional regulator [Microbacterium sp.]MBT9605906.1 helix-turn-helix transcriptional regulator [Microbacterium sp.]